MRKIELMHSMFGKTEGLCRECFHYQRFRYRDKTYRKCDVYGLTHSESSDWKASYPACGLFNTEYDGREVIRYVTPEKKKEIEDEPLPGQMELF